MEDNWNEEDEEKSQSGGSWEEEEENRGVTSGHVLREKLVFLAKCAELAGRFEDMRKHVRALVFASQEDREKLNIEERNLFSVAYKTIISDKRSSWMTLSQILRRGKKRGLDLATFQEEGEEYVDDIGADIVEKCEEALDMVKTVLLPQAHGPESKAFYHKLCGDYYRYCAEVQVDADREKSVELALNSYELALQECKSGLQVFHPVRLAVVTNLSIFLHEIVADVSRAIIITKEAVSETKSAMPDVPQEQYKDVCFSLQLMQDNLVMWGVTEEKKSKKFQNPR